MSKRNLSVAATLCQSGPETDGNEGVFCIPPSSSITGASPSDCLVSYPERPLSRGLTPLQRCCRHILHRQPTGPIIKLK